jgi:hypothetical protein
MEGVPLSISHHPIPISNLNLKKKKERRKGGKNYIS